MAKPYDDDLRRKFLGAFDRGEGTILELSARFGVSVAWGGRSLRRATAAVMPNACGIVQGASGG
jgi:transposase